jgi:preprotein translocase subunit SecF
MQFYPLKIWSDNSNVNFMALSKFSYFLSSLVIIATFILISFFKLNLGIDFIGGVNIEIKTSKPIDIQDMRSKLAQLEIGQVSIQSMYINTQGSDNDVLKNALNSSDSNSKILQEQEVAIKISGANSMDSVIDKVKSSLSEYFGSSDLEYRKIDFVGPQVGKQLIYSGAQSIFFAFLAIMAYVWMRFEWQFGLGVVISLVHDAILCIGFMSITQLDFSLSSVAAILTVIGYSVNDSVVIYDRIRMNMRKFQQKTIAEIINISINQTLSRTTLTVFTTLIANLALILWGGAELRSFSMLVFFGIIVGTYSSIFVSAPILTLFRLEKFK